MYRQVIDGFARNNLMKKPNIPDFHLMVGSAEETSSVPLFIYENAGVPNEIVKNMAQMSNFTQNEIAEKIANNSLEVNDINGNIAMLGLSGV